MYHRHTIRPKSSANCAKMKARAWALLKSTVNGSDICLLLGARACHIRQRATGPGRRSVDHGRRSPSVEEIERKGGRKLEGRSIVVGEMRVKVGKQILSKRRCPSFQSTFGGAE